MKKVFRALWEYIEGIDKLIILIAAACSSFGIVLIYSANRGTSQGMRNIIIQCVCMGVGIILMILISKFDYDLYKDIAQIIFVVAVIALIVTFFIAPSIKGNRNWVNLGFFNLQTSEIAKAAFIITMSVHLNYLKKSIDSIGLQSLKSLAFLFLHFLGYGIPILMQGDVGSFLVYLMIFIVLLFVSGLHYIYFVGAAVFAPAAIAIVWTYLLKDYMKARILVTFSPEFDPLGIGYQAVQSKIALGSGQLTGSGLFKGIQTQYNLLPEKHTDFIFSVAGEELGFIGCSVIMLLLAVLIIKVAVNGVKARDELGLFICTGAAAMLAVQAIENIGMCVGILPIIGITLPLFSYGGSSMMSVFIILGLVQSVRLHSGRLSYGENLV